MCAGLVAQDQQINHWRSAASMRRFCSSQICSLARLVVDDGARVLSFEIVSCLLRALIATCEFLVVRLCCAVVQCRRRGASRVAFTFDALRRSQSLAVCQSGNELIYRLRRTVVVRVLVCVVVVTRRTYVSLAAQWCESVRVRVQHRVYAIKCVTFA